MKGTKLILFGIAVILTGIAISTMNFFGFLGGGGGLTLALIGLFTKEDAG